MWPVYEAELEEECFRRGRNWYVPRKICGEDMNQTRKGQRSE